MSANNLGGRLRTVVPRWRSFLNTPSPEILPTNRFPDHEAITDAAFASLVKGWRTSGGVEDAVDIMDAGIASGSRKLAVEGARKIFALPPNTVQQRVHERAETILFGGPRHRQTSSVPDDEQNAEDVHRKIARLKVDCINHPRNGLAHVEIARLYSRLAHFEKANHHMQIALMLSPNDRFTLRAATRFFTMLDAHSEALTILRKSSSIKWDSWIQSAELSAAALNKTPPRASRISAEKLIKSLDIDIGTSELAVGWATFKHNKGISTKHALRVLRSSLKHSTENAAAQSVWFTDQIGESIHGSLPSLNLNPDAFEAMSITLAEERNYSESLDSAIKWFIDQPFQVRAPVQICFISFVHLQRYDIAFNYAKAGLILHPRDWLLTNLAGLSAAFLGRLPEANIYMKKFEKLAEDAESKVFLSALKGAIAFEQGDFANGVSNYVESIRAANRIGRGDLVANAATYLLELSAKHRLVLISDVNEMRAKIEKIVSSLSLGKRKGMKDILDSRWSVVETYMEDLKEANFFTLINSAKAVLDDVMAPTKTTVLHP